MEPCVTPDVSVIIPAHNALPYLTATIGSVMGQSIGTERLELIVVDNGSTDGTGEEIDRLAALHPEMRVVHQENTGGPAGPRNRGIEMAEGRYLFFLDADDRIGVEALERMVAMADEQGTDVVLGKMVGVGGRRGPTSMFTHNQSHTDVFHSRVYWTLNPMKLFRRELVEQLGLRFQHDLSPAEDQPFVAMAYLNASGISVISDYDFVYWTERGDSGNLSNAANLQSQIRIHSVMLPLITENTEPGRDRDHLLQRHFEMGLFAAVRFLAREKDPEVRQQALAQIKGWIDELYNEDLGMRLRPLLRICYELIKRERLDDIRLALAEHKTGKLRTPVIEGGLAYDPYPFFRDPGSGLPDYCYDITDRILARAHLARLSWKGTVLRLAGHAYIDGLDSSLSEMELVLRKRDVGSELVFPVETISTPELAAEQGQGVFDYGNAGFAVEVDVAAADDGAPVTDGLWDIYVRVLHGELVRDARLGRYRDPKVRSDGRLRLIVTENDVSVATVYHTKDHDNITLDVGENSARVRLKDASVRWSPTVPGALEVAGSVNVLRVQQGAISVRLTGAGDVAYEVPALSRAVEGSTTFFATIPVNAAADDHPVPAGDWRLSAHLHAGPVDRAGKVLCKRTTKAIRWWNGVRPMHAKLLSAEEGAVLRVQPVNLTRAVARRVRGASGDGRT
jgi:glycosyltransferase involved in cell wall biosynthesis